MTNKQEAEVQKLALEAAKSVDQREKPIATAIERSIVAKWFKAGAQTILENPVEWGLVPKDEFDLAESNYDFFHVKCAEAEYQLTKYKEALEYVLQLLQARRPNTPGLGAPINIIKEALEQESEK